MFDLFPEQISVHNFSFKVLITKGSAVDLALDIGTGALISFKPSAVHII